MAEALYVHIPFCRSICAYCDFCKVLYNEPIAESYLSALFAELDSYHIDKVKTIYVGGGTPSALSPSLLSVLLSKLSPLLEEKGEFTVEVNPESLDENKIAILKENKVNRVSVGAESSLPKYLDIMGRKHRFEDVKEAVAKLKKAGISNINVDWIYCLPGESLDDLRLEEEAFASLDVPHISAYTLILEDGTLFKAKGIKEASEDEQGEQYEEVLRFLRSKGYRRYEVSNFAKPFFESRHNLVYWRDEEYYGVGVGASGFLNGVRYSNTRSLTRYLKGEGLALNEEKSGKSEFLLSTLRLEEGFSLSDFKKRFGSNFLDEYKEKVEKLVSSGLLSINDGRVKPSDKGIELLDFVLLSLLA